jgi:6-phosphogluconolactonase
VSQWRDFHHGLLCSAGVASIITGTPGDLVRALADRFADEARGAIRARTTFHAALPGGSVIRMCAPLLAGTDVNWTLVDWWWVDERAVPADHPESNYGLARALLLDRVSAPPARIHRMPADAQDLEAAATAYANDMTGVLGTPPKLDLALLGVGPDGHVASLFPRHPALQESRRYVLRVENSPKPPPRRLTLTLAALAVARQIWIAGWGLEKRAVLAEALRNPVSALPVAQVARAGPPVTWFVDVAT